MHTTGGEEKSHLGGMHQVVTYEVQVENETIGSMILVRLHDPSGERRNSKNILPLLHSNGTMMA